VKSVSRLYPEEDNTGKTCSGICRRVFTDLTPSPTALYIMACRHPLLGNDREISIRQPLLSNVSTATREYSNNGRDVWQLWLVGELLRFSLVVNCCFEDASVDTRDKWCQVGFGFID
jgi:hypothetical protein